jgi:hypothetical protein
MLQAFRQIVPLPIGRKRAAERHSRVAPTEPRNAERAVGRADLCCCAARAPRTAAAPPTFVFRSTDLGGDGGVRWQPWLLRKLDLMLLDLGRPVVDGWTMTESVAMMPAASRRSRDAAQMGLRRTCGHSSTRCFRSRFIRRTSFGSVPKLRGVP